MAPEFAGLIGMGLVLLLMFLGLPISITLILTGFLGGFYFRGWEAISTAINTIVWSHSYDYLYSTIPLFVFMGALLYASGISSELFGVFRKWFGSFKGGLALATVGASTIFAAASGSSIANTGTMGVVASREMQKYGYNEKLSSGAVLAGGTLGMLIPPSTLFILYGILAEESIGRLLIAGIIPGIILSILYILTIIIWITFKPGLAPKTESFSLKEKLTSLNSIIWILLIFIVVIGGMYAGFFGPTEAAGIGAFLVFLIALVRRKLTLKTLIQSLNTTITTTGFIFAIMIGGFVMNYFLTLSRLPMLLADFVTSLSINPVVILLFIVLLYFILGALMDSMAMMVVTLPIMLPIIASIGYDFIWFGVMIVILVELALITPPIGMLGFVLKGAVPELKLSNIFLGAMVMIIPIMVLLMLLIAFPEIALFLPERMFSR